MAATFGARLRRARLALDKTQEALAAEVGVTKASVSSWENGRDTPSFAYLGAIRMALGVPLDYLVCAIDAGAGSVREDAAEYGPAGVAWARNVLELRLLARFRNLDYAHQLALLTLIDPAADNEDTG